MPLAFLLVATTPTGQSLPSQNTILAAQTSSQDEWKQSEITTGSIIHGLGHSEQASLSDAQQVATLDPAFLRQTSLPIASGAPGRSPALVPGQFPVLIPQHSPVLIPGQSPAWTSGDMQEASDRVRQTQDQSQQLQGLMPTQTQEVFERVRRAREQLQLRQGTTPNQVWEGYEQLQQVQDQLMQIPGLGQSSQGQEVLERLRKAEEQLQEVEDELRKHPAQLQYLTQKAPATVPSQTSLAQGRGDTTGQTGAHEGRAGPNQATSNTGLPEVDSVAALAPDAPQINGASWHGSTGEEDTGAETRPAEAASGRADPNFCRTRFGYIPDPASQVCWYICSFNAGEYRCCSAGYCYLPPSLVFPLGACWVRSSGLIFLFLHIFSLKFQ
jgi:hypothetical protein